jgi:hypothetical protein
MQFVYFSFSGPGQIFAKSIIYIILYMLYIQNKLSNNKFTKTARSVKKKRVFGRDIKSKKNNSFYI